MHCLDGRTVGRVARDAVVVISLTLWLTAALHAQAGTIQGRITKTAGGPPVAGALLHIKGTALGARTGDDGVYTIAGAPTGGDTVLVRAAGFFADSFVVVVREGQTVHQDLALKENAAQLQKVVIQASPRLNETVEAAREKQKDAPNIVDVLSGDEIRSLPALNAAEAAERIPGVTTERDEGEGKFVQVRGTEPTLQNVTVNGANIPGTLNGDRSVKLDDIPSDVIGAIEVSKTLTADMDADAIGGSVNIVSKVPEGPPRGYVAGQVGLTSPAIVNASSQNFGVGQGSLFYGGRVGQQQKFGFLFGGSFDRNDRPISDMEPSWGATTFPTNVQAGSFFPNSIDSRIYRYFRQRYGADAEMDYRFDTHSSVFLKGLYSQFLNHGYRYVYNVSAAQDGPGGFGIDGSASENVSNRTPNEQLYAVTAGGKKDNLGPFQLDYQASAGGTASSQSNYRFSTFTFNGPLTYKYDNSNVIQPKFAVTDPHMAAALADPSNWTLAGYNATNNLALGLDAGVGVNLQLPYKLGGQTALLRFGAKYRNEQKGFTNTSVTYSNNTLVPITMADLLGDINDPNYYHNVFPVVVPPFASIDRTSAFENSHPQLFTNVTDTLRNAAANYFGREQITAGYVENTVDLGGAAHLNLGLRLEQTRVTYTGNQFNASASQITSVTGTNSYTDLFPSVQLRYEIDPNTNARVAFTRGISRAAYSDLAPHLTGEPNSSFPDPAANNSLSSGNPGLKPETAWNYDLLFEHFLPKAGVISGGVFYKDLHDFIFNQRFFNYQGPIVAFQGANGLQPQNGRSAYLYGIEADFAQHLTFLRGAWAGLGFDVNWTHVESRTSYQIDSVHVRHGLLPRTSPNIGNASLLYDWGHVNARVAWVYQSAMLASTGGNPRQVPDQSDRSG
jgi:TonB-dependent receptor